MKSVLMKIQRIEKPRGYELDLARTETDAGNILCIYSGHRLSLQHQSIKDETLYLLRGETTLEIDENNLLTPKFRPNYGTREREQPTVKETAWLYVPRPSSGRSASLDTRCGGWQPGEGV